MHWRKLSFFLCKSLVLCTNGIFRIGVTTKDPNITAISIPWRKCPYRDRNANAHHCNAKALRWGLLRWRHCMFHSHLKSWSLDWHPRILEWAMMVYFQTSLISEKSRIKKIYNPIKNCGLRHMYVCFYATNHLRFCGIYSMRIWPI